MDKKVLLGIGIGFVISSLLMISMPSPKLTKDRIESEARGMGMIYKDEAKALYSK